MAHYHKSQHYKKHHYSKQDLLCSAAGLILILISILMGSFYFMSKKGEVDTFTEKALSETQFIQDELSAITLEEDSQTADDFAMVPDKKKQGLIEIAAPENLLLIITDPNGKTTGRDGINNVFNNIPNSEYSIDAKSDDMSWITIKEPAKGQFLMSVIESFGKTDDEKVIVIYGTNSAGAIFTKFIDLKTSTLSQSFVYDPNSDESIVLN